MYCTSMGYLTPDEMQSTNEMRAQLDFDEAVEKKLGPSMMKDDTKDDPDLTDFETKQLLSLMKMRKILLPRCRILMTLTLMTNMFAIK
jgi:hypothetical protein